MATGDQTDFTGRIRAVLPGGWFPTPTGSLAILTDGFGSPLLTESGEPIYSEDDRASFTPVLDGVLAGLGNAWAWLYALLQYVVQQTRIGTAAGVFLDIISGDFFGTKLLRLASESDAHFATRIKLELLRPRATRASVVQALTDLTGRAPGIFEPANPSDTGGYGSGISVLAPVVQNVGGLDTNHSVPPFIAGAPVYFSYAPLTGDTNIGFLSATLAAGEKATVTVGFYIPAGYSGGTPSLAFEGANTSTQVSADPSKTNQWQTLTVTIAAQNAGTTYAVLRAQGAGANNTLYSTWGIVRGSYPTEPATGLAYGTAGGYGSLQLPYQFFVTAFRPHGGGIATVSGYGSGAGGYGAGAIEWASQSFIQGFVSDSDIYAAVNAVRPACSIAWTKIES